MPRLALLTLDVGKPAIHPTAQASHEAAARRWGCEYVIHRKPLAPGKNPYEEKLHLDKRATGFDRVIYVDRDVVIRHDCPSLLELVPAGSFGYVPHVQDRYETLAFTQAETVPALAPVLAAGGVTTWDWARDYMDSGVLVFDAATPVFARARSLLPAAVDVGWRVVDQGLLSVALKASGVPTHVLPSDYNQRSVGMLNRRPKGMAFPVQHFTGTWRKTFLVNAAWEKPPGKVNPPAVPRKYQVTGAKFESWGAKMWREMHLRALAWDGGHAATEVSWLHGLTAKIPRCSDCREEWRRILAADPPKFTTAVDYFAWTHAAHQKVNAKLNKPGLTLEEARAYWTAQAAARP